MTCRIAALLHCSPSDAEDLAVVDRYLLVQYWHEEPWGPWRDNLHAAIIAREIRRGYMKDRSAPLPVGPFMYRLEEDRQAQNRAGLVQLLRLMAGAPRKASPAPAPTEG